jgi:hypothetical protein
MSNPQTDFESANLVPYATPIPGMRSSATWAAAVIAFVALGLIVLGGCFLVGVLETLSSTMLTTGRQFFVVVLYVATFACFGGALWLLVLSVGRLLKLSRRD